MSNVVSLLSESQWQGVPLKGLFEPRAIPHTDRISVQGPDITVSARAPEVTMRRRAARGARTSPRRRRTVPHPSAA